MDCEQMLELIHHYMDGGLPQWRMRAITRHLDDCPPCMQGYRVELHFRTVVATKCQEELPYNLRQRIEDALGCLPPPHPSPGGGFITETTMPTMPTKATKPLEP